MIKRKHEILINITPEEMADEFCGMDANEQAKFFSEVYKIARTWDRNFEFQMQSIIDSNECDDYALKLLSIFGEYASKCE